MKKRERNGGRAGGAGYGKEGDLKVGNPTERVEIRGRDPCPGLCTIREVVTNDLTFVTTDTEDSLTDGKRREGEGVN